jgi:hypothetical protein
LPPPPPAPQVEELTGKAGLAHVYATFADELRKTCKGRGHEARARSLARAAQPPRAAVDAAPARRRRRRRRT